VSTPERVTTDPRANYAPQPGARSLPRVGAFTAAGLFLVSAAGPVAPADPSLGAPAVRLAPDFIEASLKSDEGLSCVGRNSHCCSERTTQRLQHLKVA
jgi:hypothetical protein